MSLYYRNDFIHVILMGVYFTMTVFALYNVFTLLLLTKYFLTNNQDVGNIHSEEIITKEGA